MKFPLITLLLLIIPLLSFGQEIQINPLSIIATSATLTDENNTVKFGPENVLDGETLEGFTSAGDAGPPVRPAQHQDNHWITEDGNLTATITFDLSGVYDLTRIEVLNTSNSNWNDRETDSFTIETSTDGGTVWSNPSEAIELQDYVDGFQEVIFPVTEITHIRLNVENLTTPDDDSEPTGDTAVGLNEVRFFATPTDDTDGDGLSDSWEIEYFGDLSHTGDADDDLDGNNIIIGDGLTNLEEQSSFTDPLNPDSDEDGLTDGEEVKTHSSDPNDIDSDGDTLTDAQEVNNAENPSNPNFTDSDGDGLSDFDEVNTHLTLANNADTDEDNIADDIEIFHLMTDPLVFTPRPGLIIPSTIIVSAGTTQEPRFNAQNLVDDKTLEGFKNDVDPEGIRPIEHQDNHWMSDQGVFTETLTFDLGGSYSLSHLEVLNTSNTNWNDAETNSFTISSSTDGGTSFTDPSEPIALQDYLEGFQNIPFSVSGVTHVQLVVTNIAQEARVGLNEVRFYTGSSSLEISSVAYVTEATEASITWNSISGATYILEFSDDLEFWTEVDDSVNADAEGDTTTYIHTFDPQVPFAKRFYRVSRNP